jgi:hypothetical protein
MKRALIVASVGILTSTVWVAAANAQANINPNVYPGNTSERYGAQARWEVYGPSKRGAMCMTSTDPTRGYGFQQTCPAPKAAASASTRTLSARAAAPTRKHKAVSR